MTNNKHILSVKIKMPNGECFYTEIVKEGNKLITGTFTKPRLLRDPWEVDIEEYRSELDALQELYANLEEYANSPDAMEVYA